jgi:endonuclease/exonuclease/phosphatase family metal-dependent hydrolase
VAVEVPATELVYQASDHRPLVVTLRLSPVRARGVAV